MLTDRRRRLIVCLGGLLIGCHVGTRTPTVASTSTASAPVFKGRAQLWAEACARCHNMRSPSSYTDAQWETIVHHMRVRGYLTAEEHRAIVEFLKAGN